MNSRGDRSFGSSEEGRRGRGDILKEVFADTIGEDSIVKNQTIQGAGKTAKGKVLHLGQRSKGKISRISQPPVLLG